MLAEYHGAVQLLDKARSFNWLIARFASNIFLLVGFVSVFENCTLPRFCRSHLFSNSSKKHLVSHVGIVTKYFEIPGTTSTRPTYIEGVCVWSCVQPFSPVMVFFVNNAHSQSKEHTCSWL